MWEGQPVESACLTGKVRVEGEEERETRWLLSAGHDKRIKMWDMTSVCEEGWRLDDDEGGEAEEEEEESEEVGDDDSDRRSGGWQRRRRGGRALHPPSSLQLSLHSISGGHARQSVATAMAATTTTGRTTTRRGGDSVEVRCPLPSPSVCFCLRR